MSKNTVIYAGGGTGKADSAVHLLNVNRNEVAVCVKKFKIGG